MSGLMDQHFKVYPCSITPLLKLNLKVKILMIYEDISALVCFLSLIHVYVKICFQKNEPCVINFSIRVNWIILSNLKLRTLSFFLKFLCWHSVYDLPILIRAMRITYVKCYNLKIYSYIVLKLKYSRKSNERTETIFLNLSLIILTV